MASRRERFFAYAAVALLGFWALDSLVIGPLATSRDALADRRASLEAELAKAHRTLSDGRRAARQWRSIRATGVGDGSAAAGAGLLNTLLEWSRDADLRLQSIRPDRAAELHGLRELTFQASGDGGMAAMTRFAYRVETAGLPIRPRELQIAARTEGSDELTMQVRLSTIWEEGGQAGPAPKEAAASPRATPTPAAVPPSPATPAPRAVAAPPLLMASSTQPSPASAPSPLTEVPASSATQPASATQPSLPPPPPAAPVTRAAAQASSSSSAPGSAWSPLPRRPGRETYDLIARRSIFRRGGFDPASTQAATAPATAPAGGLGSATAPAPPAAYILTGTAVQASERVALFESTRDGLTIRVRPGEETPAGRVLEIEPGSVTLQSAAGPRTVAVGEGLDGSVGVTMHAGGESGGVGAGSASGQSGSGADSGTTSAAEAAMIERMRARRNQELSR